MGGWSYAIISGRVDPLSLTVSRTRAINPRIYGLLDAALIVPLASRVLETLRLRLRGNSLLVSGATLRINDELEPLTLTAPANDRTVPYQRTTDVSSVGPRSIEETLTGRSIARPLTVLPNNCKTSIASKLVLECFRVGGHEMKISRNKMAGLSNKIVIFLYFIVTFISVFGRCRIRYRSRV